PHRPASSAALSQRGLHQRYAEGSKGIMVQPLVPGKKLPYGLHKLLGFLQPWRVPTAVDDMQGSMRQRLLVELATIDRDDGILLAPDNQRGRFDAKQVGWEFRVVEVRFPAQTRGHLAVTPLHLLLFRGELPVHQGVVVWHLRGIVKAQLLRDV